MYRSIAAVSALILLSPLTSPTPPPAAPAWTVPADVAKLAKPAKSTPESRLQAKKNYGYDCAMCHGKLGRGDGEPAVDQ